MGEFVAFLSAFFYHHRYTFFCISILPLLAIARALFEYARDRWHAVKEERRQKLIRELLLEEESKSSSSECQSKCEDGTKGRRNRSGKRPKPASEGVVKTERPALPDAASDEKELSREAEQSGEGDTASDVESEAPKADLPAEEPVEMNPIQISGKAETGDKVDEPLISKEDAQTNKKTKPTKNNASVTVPKKQHEIPLPATSAHLDGDEGSVAAEKSEAGWSVVPTKHEEVVAGLKAKIGSLQAGTRRLQSRYDDMLVEKDAMMHANKDLQKTISGLNQQSALLESDLRVARAQNLANVKQLESLHGVGSELSTLKTELGALSCKLAAAETQSLQHQQERQALQNSLKAAQQSLEHGQEKTLLLEKRATAAEDKVAELQKLLATKMESLGIVEHDYGMALERMRTFEAELVSNSGMLCEMQRLVDAKTDILLSTEQDLASMKAFQSDLVGRSEQLEQSLLALNQAHAVVLEECRALKQKVVTCDKALDAEAEQRRQAETECVALKAALAASIAAQHEAEEKLDASGEEQKLLTEAARELASRAEHLAVSLSKAREEKDLAMQRLQSELDSLQATCASLADSNALLASEKTLLVSQLALAASEHEACSHAVDSTKKLAQAEAELADARKDCIDWQERAKSHLSQLVAAKQQLRDLQSKAGSSPSS